MNKTLIHYLDREHFCLSRVRRSTFGSCYSLELLQDKHCFINLRSGSLSFWKSHVSCTLHQVSLRIPSCTFLNSFHPLPSEVFWRRRDAATTMLHAGGNAILVSSDRGNFFQLTSEASPRGFWQTGAVMWGGAFISPLPHKAVTGEALVPLHAPSLWISASEAWNSFRVVVGLLWPSLTSRPLAQSLSF